MGCSHSDREVKNKEEHNKQFAAGQHQPNQTSAPAPTQNQQISQPVNPQPTIAQPPPPVVSQPPKAAHTNFDYGEDDAYNNYDHHKVGSRIQKYPLPAFDATSAHY